MKRIVLTGAECTGKTTLAQALSGYYGEPWTGEYVREYVRQLERPLAREDLEPIARGQLAVEDSALDRAKRLVLHDTNLFSSILYANHYFDTQIEWVSDAFLLRDYALYLLCTPDGIEWEADPGQRESPAAREALHHRFKAGLETMGLPFIELRGSLEARFAEAILAMDRVVEK
jgi:nicotinamide riboside kinase